MHPFWLTFKNKHLEKLYEQQLTRNDVSGWLLSTSLQLLWVLRKLADGHREFWRFPFLGAIGTLIGSLAVACVYHLIGKKNLGRWRPWLIFIWRLWMAYFTSNYLRYSERRIPQTMLPGVAMGFVSNGLTMSIMCSYTNPLKFKHHLFMMLGMMNLMMIVEDSSYCQCALKFPGGAHFLKVGRLIEQIARVTHLAVWGLDPIERNESDMALCLQLGVFAYLYVGVMLLSYQVWKGEFWSRISILRASATREEVAMEIPNPAALSVGSSTYVFTSFWVTLVMTWDASALVSKLMGRV